MKKYTKSITKSKAERERRRQVLAMHSDGFTQQQIASKLGVSSKTVWRDLQKMKRWLSKLSFDLTMESERLLSERLDSYPKEVQFTMLTDLLLARGTRGESRLMMDVLAGKYKHKRRREC